MLRYVCISAVALVTFGCVGPESQVASVRQIRPSFEVGGGPIDTGAAGPELLYKPSSVAVGENHNVYVMDGGNYRIAVFARDGSFLHEFGGPGRGPGEFGSARFAYLATSNGRVARLGQGDQQIQLFSVSGEFQLAVATEVPVGSMALTSDRLYAYALAEGGRRARLQVYALDGDLLEVVPDELVSQSPNAHELYALNSSSIAATNEGVVAQAYLHWPLLRVHGADDGRTDYWLGFDWLDVGDLKRRIQRPKSLLTDPNVHMLHDEMRPVVSYDLEYVASSGQWATLLYYGVIQILTQEGGPVETIKLQLPERYGEEFLINDIAIDPSGELVCALESFEGRVFCFELGLE